MDCYFISFLEFRPEAIGRWLNSGAMPEEVTLAPEFNPNHLRK